MKTKEHDIQRLEVRVNKSEEINIEIVCGGSVNPLMLLVGFRLSLFMSCGRPYDSTERSDNVVLLISLKLAAERRVCIHGCRNPYPGGVWPIIRTNTRRCLWCLGGNYSAPREFIMFQSMTYQGKTRT